jgi:ATP-dependent RNA helicase DDX10/DBP4
VSYVRSIYLQKDKSVFKFNELPLEAYAESLGLAGAPKVKFIGKQETSSKKNALRSVPGLEKTKGKDKMAVVGSSGEDDSESEEDEDDSVCHGCLRTGTVGDADDASFGNNQAAPKVKTKYDRMFGRKNQSILSEHYSKLVDHSTDALGLPTREDDTDDFITLTRRDHDLPGNDLPDSADLSKRQLKRGQSKKAMAAKKGTGTKLVFDEDGVAHELYELEDEEAFRKQGDARELGRKFVEEEKEVLKKRDVEDREIAREKRREKKRKRKDRDRVRRAFGVVRETQLTMRVLFRTKRQTIMAQRCLRLLSTMTKLCIPTLTLTSITLQPMTTRQRSNDPESGDEGLAARARSIWKPWRCERSDGRYSLANIQCFPTCGD